MGNQAGKDRTLGGGKEYYETCPDFYKICDYEFEFGLDAAANNFNKKHVNFFSKEENSLVIPWKPNIKPGKSVWLNPPYGRGMVPAFLEKCWKESQLGCTIAVLIHTCPDTKYWCDWIFGKAAEVRHVRGRLNFWLPEPDKKGNYGTVSDLPHSLIVYRPRYLGETYQSSWKWKDDYIERFGKLPVRDKKSKDRYVKEYLLHNGTREKAA